MNPGDGHEIPQFRSITMAVEVFTAPYLTVYDAVTVMLGAEISAYQVIVP